MASTSSDQQTEIPDQGPDYLILFGTLTGFAALLVAARFWIRALLLRHVGADDWVVLLSLALVFGSLGCLVTSVHYGLGRHAHDLTREAEIDAIKWLWIAFNITPAAEITAKISITLMLMRITTKRAWQAVFIALIASSIAITIMSNLSFLLSCRPLHKLWDPSIDGVCATDWRNAELYIQGVSAAAYDLVLAFAPVMLLWGVKITIRDKILLCGLFALGMVTAIAGVLRIRYTDATSYSNDATWDTMGFVRWKCIELPLSIIVGCLPTLRPIFKKKQRADEQPIKLKASSYQVLPDGCMAIRKTTDIYVQSSSLESANSETTKRPGSGESPGLVEKRA